jgi:glycine cleavage system H protein
MAHDPNNVLELMVDKFIFRFPKDLYYSESGVWIRREENRVRIGLSDFAQQRSGDIAFANLTAPGTALEVDDEIATVETVKVNVSLPSPLKGKILEVNSALQESPEWINQDPYGRGWIALVEPEGLEQQMSNLLEVDRYVDLAREQAEAELKS